MASCKSSSYPRMNQELQTKAMALLTALLQGATPAERKVGIHLEAGWGQELVDTAHGGAKSFKLPSHHLSICLTTCGRETFANSSIR